jgi:hypothetical protein
MGEAQAETNQVETNKPTLTEAEFCKAVGISRTTAWRLRNARPCKLSHLKIGSKILYRNPQHIDEFVSRVEKRAATTR